MELKVYKNYKDLSHAVADEVVELLKENPEAVICLASGDSPRLTCQLLVQQLKAEHVDTTRFTFIGLDEWVGIPPSNEGSCHYFFQHEIFKPMNLSMHQTHLFDATSRDLAEECEKMDAFIAQKKGIDLMIVGIGMNGHIGFNEPGVSFDNYSHVIDLDEMTLTVGQKYFKTAVPLQKGITLGLKHLLESKKAILMANGDKKASVIKKAAELDVTNNFPASIMQTHTNGAIMIDEEAASLLQVKK